MSIDGAGKLHVFVCFVVALAAIGMIAQGNSEARAAGLVLLVLDVLFLGKFYDKL